MCHCLARSAIEKCLSKVESGKFNLDLLSGASAARTRLIAAGSGEEKPARILRFRQTRGTDLLTPWTNAFCLVEQPPVLQRPGRLGRSLWDKVVLDFSLVPYYLVVKDMSRLKGVSPAITYLRSLSPNSARSAEHLLDNAATLLSGTPCLSQDFDWSRLQEPDIRQLREALENSYAISTANVTLTAIRGVLREACRQGMMPVDQYLAAAEVPGPSRQRREETTDIAPVDIHKILELCRREADDISARDMALVALLYGVGLSGSAIVELDLGDLDVEDRSLTTNLKSVKKVYSVDDIYDWLDPWIQLRVQAAGAGPLFVGVDKGGRLLERRLAPQIVHDVLVKRAKQVGLGKLTVAATRRLAHRERLRLKLEGRPDRDDRGRIYCLPLPR